MEPQVQFGVSALIAEDAEAMHTTQYISYAEECFRMALAAKRKAEETAWLDSSCSWLRLAGLQMGETRRTGPMLDANATNPYPAPSQTDLAVTPE